MLLMSCCHIPDDAAADYAILLMKRLMPQSESASDEMIAEPAEPAT